MSPKTLDNTPPLVARSEQNRIRLRGLYRIYLENFVYKKEKYSLNVESEANFFKKTLEGISNLLKLNDYDLLDLEDYTRLWKFLIAKSTTAQSDVYQMGIFLALVQNNFKFYVSRVCQEKNYSHLRKINLVKLLPNLIERIVEAMIESLLGILEYYANRVEEIKYGPKIIAFCMDMFSHLLNLAQQSDKQSHDAETFIRYLDTQIVRKLFYLICKASTGNVC